MYLLHTYSWMFFYLQRNAEGRELFDEVCKKLCINEKEYFGLTYTGAQDVKVCVIYTILLMNCTGSIKALYRLIKSPTFYFKSYYQD